VHVLLAPLPEHASAHHGAIAPLSPQVHVLLATPGRLLDFLEAGVARLDDVSYAVLDEADRMLDMGFEKDVHAIMRIVPSNRQTLLFSATWPPEFRQVRELAASLQHRPLRCQVAIGSVAERLATNRDVEQRILFVRTEAERDAALHRQLQLVPATARVLVFVSTKKTCETLARSLRREHTCAALHGDKDQSERERTLSEFRSGVVPVLIATDVAARGLDIPVRGL